MMEIIFETGVKVEILDDGSVASPVIFGVWDENGDYGAGSWLTVDEAIELANALYAAAGVQPVIGLRGITSVDFGDDNSLDAIAADPGIQRENSAITYEFDGTETDGLDDDHDTAQEAK